jgi:hypothetical protein
LAGLLLDKIVSTEKTIRSGSHDVRRNSSSIIRSECCCNRTVLVLHYIYESFMVSPSLLFYAMDSNHMSFVFFYVRARISYSKIFVVRFERKRYYFHNTIIFCWFGALCLYRLRSLLGESVLIL